MRRFLFAFFLVATLSAVFSFSAFADSVVSSYQGSGSVVVEKKVTFPVSAAAGDQFYFDVSIVHQSDIIYDPSGRNISAQVYNKNLYWSWVVEPLGCNYAAASLSSEGSRIWVFFDRPISSGSITITYQITYTAYWRGGTFNGTPTVDLSTCSYQASFVVSNGSFTKNGSGWATDQTNSDKLDRILDALGESPSVSPDFLGDDALIYFDGRYFDQCVNGSIVNGKITFSNQSEVRPYVQDQTRFVPLTLTKGSYLLVVSYPASSVDDGISFNFPGSGGAVSLSELDAVYSGASSASVTIRTYKLNVSSTFSVAWLGFTFDKPVSGQIYGGIARMPADLIAGDSINPDQDGTVSDVDDAGSQQSQQEEEIWQNINTYKGDISFNLDGWDDAAGGLSYVTSVFMTIWNNSPTQPIVLSLMLGIAMLSIGRGVMAAVRVSRNRGDD